MQRSMNKPKYGRLLATCAAIVLTLAGCEPPPKAHPEAAPEPLPAVHHQQVHAKQHNGSNERGTHQTTDAHGPAVGVPETGVSEKAIPEKVLKVLRHIDEYGRAPEGYEGGRVFHNGGGNGEQALPRRDANGNAISYREWDVNPHRPGVNRGAERLVTGSDHSAYYTRDHYRTFTKVR